MIKKIPFHSLYKTEHSWLSSCFHFSFAEYHNPDNIRYGPLRVMNDDRIQAKSGFETHPHHDMEIITYILKGELTHQDSMGHKESLGRGAVQYMSAGTGITHSEMNEGDNEIHLIQTWILPSKKGLDPRYGSKCFKPEKRHNRWLHLVGPKNSNAEIEIYQDASMYVAELETGKQLDFELQDDRAIYLKLMEGKADINALAFNAGDAAEIQDGILHIKAIENAHLLLVEVNKKDL